MEPTDVFSEWQRLSELYREKSDGELEHLADEAYGLTDTARQVLAGEISRRRLELKIVTTPPVSDPDEVVGPVDEIDPGALDLQGAYRAFSHEELAQAKQALDDAGIASFIGDRNLQELELFSGGFEDGIEIKVRYLDLHRASYVLRNVLPPDPEQDEPEPEEIAPKCPQCDSAEIVFLRRDLANKSKFRWRCDACGHKWIDDGVVEQS